MHVFLGMKAVIASDAMRQLMSLTERVARSNATVLILGESGSGKEVLARAIHQAFRIDPLVEGGPLDLLHLMGIEDCVSHRSLVFGSLEQPEPIIE